jgi:hypothetical protein
MGCPDVSAQVVPPLDATEAIRTLEIPRLGVLQHMFSQILGMVAARITLKTAIGLAVNYVVRIPIVIPGTLVS